MTWVIRNRRVFLVIGGIMLIGLIVWIILARQNVGKIPSRGVFV